MGTPPKDDRRTPTWFFELCVRRYGMFDLDVAANGDNAFVSEWLGPGGHAEDALVPEQVWGLPGWSVWCNPPYGPAGTIPKWIAKARQQRDVYSIRTLMLLPADTSAKWFQDVWHNELCELVPYRLAFTAPDGSTKGNSAKFGSMLVWIAPKLIKPSKGLKDCVVLEVKD